MPGRRSADPHSLVAPASWEPSPAARVSENGKHPRPTNAAGEVGNGRKPVQAPDSGEAPAEGAGIRKAAMEGVPAAVPAGMPAAMTAAVSAGMTAAVTPARRRDG